MIGDGFILVWHLDLDLPILKSGSFKVRQRILLIKSLILNILSPNFTHLAPLYYGNMYKNFSTIGPQTKKFKSSTINNVLDWLMEKLLTITFFYLYIDLFSCCRKAIESMKCGLRQPGSQILGGREVPNTHTLKHKHLFHSIFHVFPMF